MLSLRFCFIYFDSFVTSEIKIFLEFLRSPILISPGIITNRQSLSISYPCIPHDPPIQDLFLMIPPLLQYFRLCNCIFFRYFGSSFVVGHEFGRKEVALSGEEPVIDVLFLKSESLCLG